MALRFARMSPAAAAMMAVGFTATVCPTVAAQQRSSDAPASSLEEVVRDFVPEALARFRIAGASVAIVDHGTITAVGFGVSNPESGALIDPFTTRFHIASVTKLLTAVAVVQLAEAGRLRIDAPVSGYLPPELAARFRQPDIRIRDLLTHSAGLADRWVGMASTAPDGVWPLETYLLRRLPPRMEPPGTAPRYSNYGYTLAGFVVQRVSGQPYDRYITDHVLAAIGASGSYVGARPADDLDAPGFFYRDTIMIEPRVYEHTVPAGGVHAPVSDLARVVGAVVSDGSFDGKRLLSADGARLLRSPQFTPDPRLPGWGFGLYGYGDGARDEWIAGGELPGLSTRVLLMPRTERAVIVAVNRKDPSLAMELFEKIRAADRLPIAPPLRLQERTTPLAIPPTGRFRATLGDPSSFLKIADLFAPELVMRPQPGGALAVRFMNADRADSVWLPADGDLWVDETGSPSAVVGRDSNGQASQVTVADGTAGLVRFLRVEWWQTAAPALTVMASAVVTSILTLLTWVGWWRRGTGQRISPALRPPLLAIATLTLVFVGGFWVGLAQLAVLHDDRFAFGLPWWLAAALCTPAVIAGALAWLAVRWRHARPTLRGRSAIVVGWVATTTSALLVVAWYWNLFGPFT